MADQNFAQQFEDLRIWQKARQQPVWIYQTFGKGSRAERDFGFKDQIQRAGVSVMNNIAEGFERKSSQDFARFLDIAKGSCGEVRSMVYLAQDLNYITQEEASNIRAGSEEISKGIEALARRLRNKRP